jgi:hypothetical protein
MQHIHIVQSETELLDGKVASREELDRKITAALRRADPDIIGGDEGGSYDVTRWSVSAELSERVTASGLTINELVRLGLDSMENQDGRRGTS